MFHRFARGVRLGLGTVADPEPRRAPLPDDQVAERGEELVEGGLVHRPRSRVWENLYPE